MSLNKAHGGKQLEWLPVLQIASLLELQQHTERWLEETAPDEGH